MSAIIYHLQQWSTIIGILLMQCIVCPGTDAQCPLSQEVWNAVIRIEESKDPALSLEQKLKEVLLLRKKMDECGLPKDSVYARVLHRIGAYQYFSTRELNLAIRNTLESIAINTSGEKGACPRFAVDSYSNMGYFFRYLQFFDAALRYFDSSAILAARFRNEKVLLSARNERSNLYFIEGDLQTCEEEATRGLQAAEVANDTSYIIKLIGQRGYAFARQGDAHAAMADIKLCFSLSDQTNNAEGKCFSIRDNAVLLESEGKFEEALRLYNEVINYRTRSGFQDGLAEDYLDAGNLLMYKMARYAAAVPYYRKTLILARQVKDESLVAKAYNSLASVSYYSRDYFRALEGYDSALAYLGIQTGASNASNPGSTAISQSQNKEVMLWVLGNKTECLLHLFHQTGRRDYLTTCMRTALLTDTVITMMRHEQIGETSKLYWRGITREFFNNALDACWLAGDAGLAFYFMEKSRAVLLNDKLNELGAYAFLSRQEVSREQSLQIEVVQQQQALAVLSPDAPGYQAQLAKFLHAKDEHERFIRVLEQTAPAYYQYKYADDVPSIDSVRRVLARNQQSFVHYFARDTVVYLLGVSPGGTQFLRLRSPGIGDSISAWLRVCSDDQGLNDTYRAFAALSHALYLRLFEPLHLPTKRVVFCPDNFLIPFEAFCTDSTGKHFLLSDYVIDYAYSARSWLMPVRNSEGEQNFLGLAPGSFAAGLHVGDLKASVASIERAAAFYPTHTCLTGRKADRRNFLEQAASYTIVNIYSHATADSSYSEPLLFFSDSLLRLSELQMMQRPSAQLIVLSACETSAGKGASGEGIYSLARGFASAGIPAVAATLWPADERATYAITEQFHRYLALGMRKDEALRKAKLDFIEGGRSENRMPYYWADMILIGNADAVHLRAKHGVPWWVVGLAGVLVILLIGSVFLRRRKATSSTQSLPHADSYD